MRLLAIVALSLLGCGGAPASSPARGHHAPASAAVEIPARLLADEFNALMADGTLALLPLEVRAQTTVAHDKNEGRAVTSQDTVMTVVGCEAGPAEFVVDREGGVYLVNADIDAQGIALDTNLIVSADPPCVARTYALTTSQHVAHQLTIVDLLDFLARDAAP